MASRRTELVTLKVPARSQPEPNAVAPEITVEIRAAWPPWMDHEAEVLRLLAQASFEMASRVRRER